MKIIYAITICNLEDKKVLEKNINLFKESIHDIKVIINSAVKQEIDYEYTWINKVGDMKGSRHSLMNESYKEEADLYLIFDSDIEFSDYSFDEYIELIYSYKDYDFVSLYYYWDPPIPAFYTLSSSLTDFYNSKLGLNKITKNVFFDDSDFNNSTYYYPNEVKEYSNIEDILYGRSYARRIERFTDKVDELDNTTGGATIYFNREALKEEFDWAKGENNKSLTWYDSYRTMKMNCKYGGNYKFAKVPIFVKHCRHERSISLNWDSVINYIDGYNLYKNGQENHEDEHMILHTLELLMYSIGMVKKIEQLTLNEEEREVINKVNEFLNGKDRFINKYKEIKWK